MFALQLPVMGPHPPLPVPGTLRGVGVPTRRSGKGVCCCCVQHSLLLCWPLSSCAQETWRPTLDLLNVSSKVATARSINDEFCPAVDLVSDNVAKLQTLIWDASPEWYHLGLELGIKEVTLRNIKQTYSKQSGRLLHRDAVRVAEDGGASSLVGWAAGSIGESSCGA